MITTLTVKPTETIRILTDQERVYEQIISMTGICDLRELTSVIRANYYQGNRHLMERNMPVY